MICSSPSDTMEAVVTEKTLKNVEDKFSKIILRNESQVEKLVSDLKTFQDKVDSNVQSLQDKLEFAGTQIDKTEHLIEASQQMLTNHQNQLHEKLGVVGANVQTFIDDA